MSTILDIANWVTTTYLKRTDIQSLAIDAAKSAYIVVCSKVPFDQLQTTSSETAVSTSTTTHSLTSFTPAVSGIISLRMTYATGQVRRIQRSHVRVFDSLNPTRTGRPTHYARWGTGIEFNCLANTTGYTYRLRYWSTPAITLTNDTTIGATTLLTPVEWDELMKWETLYRVYTALDEHEKAAMLVQPMPMPRQASVKKTIMFEVGIIPRLWNDLLMTTSQREGPDEEFSINPRVRSYTAVG